MLPPSRILVLAPHADDESLGCGGLLTRVAATLPRVSIRLALASLSDVVLHHGTGESRMVTAKERFAEFQAVAARLGAEAVNFNFPTRRLASYYDRLLDRIEGEIESFQPDTILAPGRSFHQDHTTLVRAAYAALRPGHCPGVRTFLLYETPYYSWAASEDRFEPNCYIRLSDEEAKAKLALCALYTSQRLHEYRGGEAIRRLMLRRGCEVEAVPVGAPVEGPYAEAYRLVRGLLFP